MSVLVPLDFSERSDLSVVYTAGCWRSLGMDRRVEKTWRSPIWKATQNYNKYEQVKILELEQELLFRTVLCIHFVEVGPSASYWWHSWVCSFMETCTVCARVENLWDMHRPHLAIIHHVDMLLYGPALETLKYWAKGCSFVSQWTMSSNPHAVTH